MSQSTTEPAGACTCSATPPTMPLYRDYHLPTCPSATNGDGLRWAREVLADPVRASVEMSGMADEDLAKVRREFGSA